MSKFKETAETFAEKLAKVREDIAETERKIVQLGDDYREAMTAYTLGGGKEAANAVAYARASWTHEKQKLAELQEQAEILEAARAEKLVETFPALVKDNRAKIEAARKDTRGPHLTFCGSVRRFF